MDKLDMLFSMQKQLMEVMSKNHPEKMHKHNIPSIADAIIHECVELRDEFNWKWWKQEKVINTDNVKEEIIDIMHFTIELCLEAEIQPNDVIEQYKIKWNNNLKRQQGLIEGREDYKSEEMPGIPAKHILAYRECNACGRCLNEGSIMCHNRSE